MFNAYSRIFFFLYTIQGKAKIVRTYRPVVPACVCASTLAEWDAFVSTEDEAGVANAPLHTGPVARAAGACRVLTAGLGAGGATRVVMTA